MPYTRKTLKRACFRALRSPDLRLDTAKLEDCRARLIEKAGAKRVTLDPHQSSLIEGTVHECLHVLLDSSLLATFARKEPPPSLWETVIEALEYVIAEDILASPEETEKWRRAIDRKLSATS